MFDFDMRSFSLYYESTLTPDRGPGYLIYRNSPISLGDKNGGGLSMIRSTNRFNGPRVK